MLQDWKEFKPLGHAGYSFTRQAIEDSTDAVRSDDNYFFLCEAGISQSVHYCSLIPLFKPMKGEGSHSLQRIDVFNVCSTADPSEASKRISLFVVRSCKEP